MDGKNLQAAFEKFLVWYEENGAGGEGASMTLGEAAKTFLDASRGVVSKHTFKHYRTVLRLFQEHVGDQPLGEMTAAEVLGWRAGLFDRGLSPHTIDSYVTVVKRLFNWLHEVELYNFKAARRLKKPRLPDMAPKAVAMDDVKAVLAYLSEEQNQGTTPMAQITRDRAVVLFLLDTGCRRAGLAGLNMGRLDVAQRRAVVREKGEKERRVFFGERTQAALKDWLIFHPVPRRERTARTPVFVAVDMRYWGQRLKRNGVTHLTCNLARKAGVEGRFNPHAFRHAAAREWLRNGADLATVSQLLGHQGIGVTAMHYARWARSELAEMHDRYGAVDEM